jgi:hypothetical protein
MPAHSRAALALLLLALSGRPGGAAESVWDLAYDKSAGTRFIPVELWTGGSWDGSREIRPIAAGLAFGERGQKTISGPMDYRRPSSGEMLQVYERINGGKRQLFALTSRGDGIGRVFDSRYPRDCIDEIKFPLGLWRDGESRSYSLLCEGGRSVRPLELTIEKLDFTFRGIAHSLQFHWVIDKARGRGTDMHYVYSPGRGLVQEYGNE